MIDTAFLFEIGVTLCFQVTMLVGVTIALQKWLRNTRVECRQWTMCFVFLLALIATACLLPHRRMLSLPNDLSRETLMLVITWQSRLTIIMLTVWIGGMVIELLRRAVACVILLNFLKNRCQRVRPSDQLKRILCEADLEQLSILESAEIRGPFCWQLHRPVIVLPTFLLHEDDHTLGHVLAHELEHLRTRHPMQHFLQGLCSTIFWFHPAVWFAAGRAELTREFLCDEVAAQASGSVAAYLLTLVKVAEQCQSAHGSHVPTSALAFGNRKSSLVRRCDRLIKLAEKKDVAKSHRPLLVFALFLIAAIAIPQVWLPTNVTASSRSRWSPWPTWTARALHNSLDISVRDFERFDERSQLHEILYEN